jgi:DnaJ-domain-containing protein 1
MAALNSMSILGRVGAMLRSELAARLSGQRWGERVRPPSWRATGAEGRTARHDTRSRPASASAGARTVSSPDPELARYYANLELPYGADVDAIREARRRLLKRYHPDLHSADPEKKTIATQLAQGLNRAHDELVRRLDRKSR